MTGHEERATVVARATPEGEGGLAVIRLSGPGSAAIAGRVFRGPALRARTAVYGILHEPVDAEHDAEQQLDVIDEILALYLPGPRSYTGEDTVELFCHGGRQVAARAVRACQAAGAVAAPPGEFTRRAFLSGRLTLDQAEAVADLIQAGSDQAARAAVAQLRGGLDAELGAVEWPLLDLLTRLEGSLEFSDDDTGEADVPAAEVRLVLDEAREAIDRLLDLAPAGRLLREGIHIALVGAPNAGKSSLFNRLVGSDRALVDADPGTTRDIVTAPVRRGGRLYVLHDTAGLREAAATAAGSGPAAAAARVEAQGIERARAAAREADLVLAVAELRGDGAASACAGAHAADGAVGEGTDCAGEKPLGPAPGRHSARPVLNVLTKCDLLKGGLLKGGLLKGGLLKGDLLNSDLLNSDLANRSLASGSPAGRDSATCAGARGADVPADGGAGTCAGASGASGASGTSSASGTSGANGLSGANGASGATAAAIATSSVTGEGIDALWAAIEQRVDAWGLDEAASLGVVLNERHRQRLLESRDELAQLVALLDGGSPGAPGAGAPGAEVIGTLLASLLARLGEISGRVFTEQMLDGIFKRFCVGK